MANYISSITLPTGTTYIIKDKEGRSMIATDFVQTNAYSAGDFIINDGKLYVVNTDAAAGTPFESLSTTETTVATQLKNLKNTISGGIHYVGKTSTPLTDGSTTKPIIINGESYDQITGDLTIYYTASAGNQEFIWDGTTWQELGTYGKFGTLAYKNEASGTYVKTNSATVTIQNVTTGTDSKTLTHTITQPSITSTGNYTPAGTVGVGTGTANYTPAGTVTGGSVSITNGAGTSSDSFLTGASVATKTFTGTEATINAAYTPAGTITGDAVATVTPTTGTINSVTDAGTLPEWTSSVTNENLIFSWSAGALTTYASATVVSNVATTASTLGFSGTAGTATTTYTPAGTLDVSLTTPSSTVAISGITGSADVTGASFAGTGVELTFAGTAADLSVVGTPNISISDHTVTVPTVDTTGTSTAAVDLSQTDTTITVK